MRVRRRHLAIPVFLLMLTAILIVHFNTVTQPTSRTLASPPSTYCRSGDPRAGVYNSSRVRVLSNCQLASGVVKSVTLQDNYYQRIDVSLDPRYASLLDKGNMNYQNGSLVLELIPRDRATIPIPPLGQHITFVGPWVYDTENHWNAIYPVWLIQAD